MRLAATSVQGVAYLGAGVSEARAVRAEGLAAAAAGAVAGMAGSLRRGACCVRRLMSRASDACLDRDFEGPDTDALAISPDELLVPAELDLGLVFTVLDFFMVF